MGEEPQLTSGSIFQLVLFVLPGFLAYRVFATFIPARRLGGDTELVASSITASVIIWAASSLVLVVVSAGWNIVAHLAGGTGSVDLWRAWFGPALSLRNAQVSDLLPGIALSVLGVAAGLGAAGLMRLARGPSRVFRLAGLRWDVNPAEWTWFLQGYEPGRLHRHAGGRTRRVRKRAGHRALGLDAG